MQKVSFSLTPNRPKLQPTSAKAPSFAAAEAEVDDEGLGTSDVDQGESSRLQEEGNDHAVAGRLDDALRCWERALRLTPGRAALHELRAQVLMERGRTWEAVQAATSAAQLEPGWGDAWLTLGRAQRNYGEPGLAAHSLQRAVGLMPGNAEAATEFDEARGLAAAMEYGGSLRRAPPPGEREPSSSLSPPPASSSPRHAAAQGQGQGLHGEGLGSAGGESSANQGARRATVLDRAALLSREEAEAAAARAEEEGEGAEVARRAHQHGAVPLASHAPS